MDAHSSRTCFQGPSYEMETLSSSGKKNPVGISTRSPTIQSEGSAAPAIHASSPQEGATVQELAPVDRGVQAWTFCVAGFALEALVGGFGYWSVD